jgi:hypothetical protein
VTHTTTVATWTTAPYTGHRKRGWTVDHRVRVLSYEHGGVDVVHECRSGDDPGIGDDWTEVRVVEARDHGLRTVANDTSGMQR